MMRGSLVGSGTSSIRNLHFDVGAWLCSTHSCDDTIDVVAQHRPLWIAQYDDCDFC